MEDNSAVSKIRTSGKGLIVYLTHCGIECNPQFIQGEVIKSYTPVMLHYELQRLVWKVPEEDAVFNYSCFSLENVNDLHCICV